MNTENLWILLTFAGWISILLLPCLILLSVIAYIKLRKKIVVLISLILFFFLGFWVYISLPVGVSNIISFTKNTNPETEQKFVDFSAKITPFKNIKSKIYEIFAYKCNSMINQITYSPQNPVYAQKALENAYKAYEYGSWKTLPLYVYLATIRGENEDYDKAIYIYNKLGSSAYACHIITLYVLKKDYNSALQTINENSGKKCARRAKADIYLRMNDSDKALSCINQEIRKYPRNWLNYAQRAQIYYAMGNYKLAQKDFNKVKQLAPQFITQSLEKYIEGADSEKKYTNLRKIYFGKS